MSLARPYDLAMPLKRNTVLLLLVASLTWVPIASAAKTKVYAPPGKAGTSEYSEVVPTSGGNVLPPSMGGGNPTAAQISRIGPGKAGVRKLSKLGKQGAAAAQFAQATAPAVIHSAHGLKGPPSPTGSATLTAAPGGSSLNGVADLLGGSDAGGIGLLLPLLLAFGLGWAGAVVLLRVRRGRDTGASQP
jgi:hypothetical protein